MKLRYSVLARDVILDNETLAPVICSPLDAIEVSFKEDQKGGRVAGLEAMFFSVWYAESAEEQNATVKAVFQIIGPVEPNPPIEFEFSFAGFKRFMHRARISGLRYQGPGDYMFTLKYKNGGIEETAPPWVLSVEELSQVEAGTESDQNA